MGAHQDLVADTTKEWGQMSYTNIPSGASLSF